MAQSKPRCKPKESLTRVSEDLRLLFPEGFGRVSSTRRGAEKRDKKIEELRIAYGTLQKVGMSLMSN